MTPSEARNAIQIRYLDNFSGQFPIALDNQPFTAPNADEDIKWVRLNVQFTNGEQSSLGILGNRKFTRVGFLYIQVFTPAGHATDQNDVLAEESLTLFEGERLGNLWFTNGRIITVGEDGKWYQQNVVSELTFEAIK
jgi:hypothetical protein